MAAIVSLQFGSAFARTAFDEVGAIGAVALRLCFGALILLAVVRPRVRGWSSRTWLVVVALGFALGGMNTLIYLAFDHIPIGVAVTVEFTGPLVVALVQARRWADAAWALLAFAGVVLLGVDSAGGVEVVGLLLAAAAAVFWAAYILMSSQVGRAVDGLSGLAVSMLVAAVVVVPFGAAPAIDAVARHPTLLVMFVGVAVFTSALPYALELAALRRMPTRVFGVLSSLGPAIAALAGLVVLQEQLGAVQIVALALVTIASVGVSIARRRAVPGL